MDQVKLDAACTKMDALSKRFDALCVVKKDAETPKEPELKRVTFRVGGKAHRGLIDVGGPYDGWFRASCSCPGSKNGKVVKGAQIIGEGWEKSNCGG